RGAVEVAVESISKDIMEKFDIKQLPSNSLTPIRIVDFGCAAGPNTFIAVQGMVDAVTNKFETEGLDPKDIEFQVFFNDQVANDFNTLFATLPPDRKYYAAAVPSTFYKFLFPKGSLHFAHSSIAVNWFSELPEEVLDEKSPAFNKGRIHYLGASKEVVEAFSAQFTRDMEFFLDARAQEFVSGGLMALLVAGIPETAIASQTSTSTEFEILGSCLLDMAKMGLISEEKVDSFNLPLYYPTPSELKAVLEKNDDFVVEKIEILKNPREHITMPNVKARTLYLRSAFEKLMNQHFGEGVVDELFKRYAEKVAASPFFLNPANQRSTVMYALLKRKDY
ncbi:SAM dependent carboxyl methyltransferase, partial [Dillenia turbinata]